MRLLAFQPMVVATLTTPLLCVAALTAVLLYPEPWQVEQGRLRCVECLPVDGGMAWQLPQAGVGAGDGATVARAAAMADSWVEVSDDSDPMPPVLLAMAVWMRLTVAPALADEASAPWHEAQYDAYRAAPSGAGAGTGAVPPRAVAMACSWAVLRDESELMALTPLMPAWIRDRVAPRLLEVARAP